MKAVQGLVSDKLVAENVKSGFALNFSAQGAQHLLRASLAADRGGRVRVGNAGITRVGNAGITRVGNAGITPRH